VVLALVDAVAAVLGITQQQGKTVGESVASALEGRSRLLVFDNCEHVVDSVADLVGADPRGVGERESLGH
jgi:predicted ATPase